MKKDIIELFIYLDDFCKDYEIFMARNTLSYGSYKKPTRVPCLAISEIMTIIILFHQSPCKNFKYFYLSYLQNYTEEFPCLPSYNRFVELQQRCLGHFHALLMVLCMLAQQTGINYIDATCVPVCHNKRTSRHKVFKGLAALGKSTMGWFFGFKLHLVINEKGDLLNAQLTPGNVDDRKPVRQMVCRLTGLLFADKGYIDKRLFQDLYEKGLKLVTGVKKNMKNKLMDLNEKILLRKRSFINGFIHIFSTLVALLY